MLMFSLVTFWAPDDSDEGERKRENALVHLLTPQRRPRQHINLFPCRALRELEPINCDMTLKNPRERPRVAFELSGFATGGGGEVIGAGRVYRRAVEVLRPTAWRRGGGQGEGGEEREEQKRDEGGDARVVQVGRFEGDVDGMARGRSVVRESCLSKGGGEVNVKSQTERKEGDERTNLRSLPSPKCSRTRAARSSLM